MSLHMKQAKGDPGLFGFLGDVAKGAVGAVTGGLTGGVGGAIQGAVRGFRGQQRQGRVVHPQQLQPGGLGPRVPGVQFNPPFAGAPGVGMRIQGRGGRPLFGIGAGQSRVLQRARRKQGRGVALGPRERAALQQQGGNQGAPPEGMKLACPSGYHPNKSDYFTKSEGFIPEGTKCVKNRRRNPANPRALDRALSRLDMAKRLQNKLRGYATEKYTRAGNKRDEC